VPLQDDPSAEVNDIGRDSDNAGHGRRSEIDAVLFGRTTVWRRHVVRDLLVRKAARS